MKTANIIILCLSACLLSACVKKSEEYIKIVNKSERNIVFQANNENYFINHKIEYICHGIIFPILKDSSYLLRSVDDTGWKADFNMSPYETILIMDEETYLLHRNEPCDTIRKNVPILHYFQVTYEDMERMNLTLVYPPKEEDSEPSSFSYER